MYCIICLTKKGGGFMKKIVCFLKRWWIVAAVFIGLRSKDDLKSIDKQSTSSKHQTKEVILDEYELNTYHS